MFIETRLGMKKSAKEMSFHENNVNWVYNKLKDWGVLEKMYLGKEILLF